MRAAAIGWARRGVAHQFWGAARCAPGRDCSSGACDRAAATKRYNKYPKYAIVVAATTLKIDTAQKRRFDRLQATLRLMAGRRVTQAELLGRLLDQGEASPQTLLGKGWRPLTREEIERVHAIPVDLGFKLGDVDEAVYGRKRRSRT